MLLNILFASLIISLILSQYNAQTVSLEREEEIGEPSAKVLLYKYSDTNPVVENEDFVIVYQLVNLGSATATSIDVADRYDPNSFDLIGNFDEEGVFSTEFEELTAGGQLSFNVTVRPKLHGVYESTRARIRYVSGVPIDGLEPELKQGYSTSLGRTRIISSEENARNGMFFTREWTKFALLYGIPTIIPLYLASKRN